MKFPYFGNKRKDIPVLQEGKKRDCYLMREVGGEQVRLEKAWIIDSFAQNEKRMPNYLGLNGFTSWKIIGEFVEMPEIIFEKFNHRPFENIERLMQKFEEYGWGNKKQEKGIVATIKSKISPANYKTPQLYGAK